MEIDERWTELDYGEFDGRAPRRRSRERRVERWRGDESFAPPGGESLNALGRRVHGRVRRAGARRPPSRRSSSSPHVSPIKAALAWALGVPMGISWRMYVEDAGVSRIDIGPDGPSCDGSIAGSTESTERVEERVGGVVPRGQRRAASPRRVRQRLAPGVVGGETGQGAAQPGDVAGFTRHPCCPSSMRWGRLPERQPTSAARRSGPRRRPCRRSRHSWAGRTRRRRRTARRPRCDRVLHGRRRVRRDRASGSRVHPARHRRRRRRSARPGVSSDLVGRDPRRPRRAARAPLVGQPVGRRTSTAMRRSRRR